MPENTLKTSRTFFGLRCAKTGDLVRLEEHDDCCSTWYEFSRNTAHPVYEAVNEDALAFALFEDSPSYNAQKSTPAWGPFEREDLVPVRVVVTQEVADIELKEPLQLPSTVEKRRIPANVAARYAGKAMPTNETVYFWLVNIPDGETLESLKAHEGSVAYGGSKFFKHRIYGVCAVPDEYVDLTAGTPRALFLVSEELPYTS